MQGRQFTIEVEEFIKTPDDTKFAELKKRIAQASQEEAEQMCQELNFIKLAYEETHLASADLKQGATLGFFGGGALGIGYTRLVESAAPTTIIGWSASAGAVAGAAYSFYSAVRENAQKPNQVKIANQLRELEHFAGDRRDGFAPLAGSQQLKNNNGLTQRRPGRN